MIQALSQFRTTDEVENRAAKAESTLANRKIKKVTTKLNTSEPIQPKSNKPKSDTWEMTAHEALRVNYVDCEL